MSLGAILTPFLIFLRFGLNYSKNSILIAFPAQHCEKPKYTPIGGGEVTNPLMLKIGREQNPLAGTKSPPVM